MNSRPGRPRSVPYPPPPNAFHVATRPPTMATFPSMTEADYELVQVASGDWSVRSRPDGETFHPVIGPQAEAEALYVRQMRIVERAAHSNGAFTLWDVGLGAAANVLAVINALSATDTTVTIESFDHTAAPLRFARASIDRLPYLQGFENAVDELLARHQTEFQHGACRIRWRFHEADFPTWLAAPPTDVPGPEAVLFDAFSPARNPVMWTVDIFAGIRRRITAERPALLATYSRSTLLRVTLLEAGFHVGSGNATGEKEETTIASTHPAWIERPLDRAWLRRALRSTSAEPLRSPVYRQAPLSDISRARLLAHPQFAGIDPASLDL